MTKSPLDEAIEHADEIAEEQKEKAKEHRLLGNHNTAQLYRQRTEKYRQLAEWLRELKCLRQAIEDIKAEIENNRFPKWQIDTATMHVGNCFREYNRCIDDVLSIIEKHTGKGKEDDESRSS